MKILKFLFLLKSGIILISFSGKAQSTVINEKFYLNNIILNPAVSGSEFDPALNISAAKSWLGINNSPSNQMISTSLRIGNFDFYNPKMFLNKTNLKAYEKIGMGAVIYNKKEGPVYYRGAQLAYAYHIPLRESRLSLGLSGTFQSRLLDQSSFLPVNPVDPGIDYSKEIFNAFNSNVGIYYYNSNYYTGLSALNLFPVEKEYLQVNREFCFHSGYIIKNFENLMIEPSIYLRLRNSKELWYAFFTKAWFRDLSWVAIGYQSDKAFNIKAAFKVRSFYISYAVGFNTTRLAKYNAGSHEIGIGLNIGTRRLEGY